MLELMRMFFLANVVHHVNSMNDVFQFAINSIGVVLGVWIPIDLPRPFIHVTLNDYSLYIDDVGELVNSHVKVYNFTLNCVSLRIGTLKAAREHVYS